MASRYAWKKQPEPVSYSFYTLIEPDQLGFTYIYAKRKTFDIGIVGCVYKTEKSCYSYYYRYYANEFAKLGRHVRFDLARQRIIDGFMEGRFSHPMGGL